MAQSRTTGHPNPDLITNHSDLCEILRRAKDERGLSYGEIFARSKKRALSSDGRLIAQRWTMVQLPKGTVSGVLSGRNLPSADVLASLLHVLYVAESDIPRWIAALERVRVSRMGGSRGGASKTSAPVGTPIGRVKNPFSFEVHRAIDVKASSPLPDLPLYLEREHDEKLRTRIREAVHGASALVVLVGGSSTGKTRACWEAIKNESLMPPRWRIWHPFDPTRADAVLEGLERVAPHTVIWLNEAQHYLFTPGGDRGERVAARLRALLGDQNRAPVLVLATMWPGYWDVLTERPSQRSKDSHEQARELLTDHDIAVPASFSDRVVDKLKTESGADPRLVEAATRAQGGELTQYLAGAPALLARYENATEAPKALITAAMDIRRLGHGLHIPQDLLYASTAAYLSEHQWHHVSQEKRWFEAAIKYAKKPCHGAHRPLTRIRPRPGEPGSELTLYQLADYLDQSGRQARARKIIPTAMWKALGDHVQDRSSALAISSAAVERMLYCHEVPLCVAPPMPAVATLLTGWPRAWPCGVTWRACGSWSTRAVASPLNGWMHSWRSGVTWRVYGGGPRGVTTTPLLGWPSCWPSGVTWRVCGNWSTPATRPPRIGWPTCWPSGVTWRVCGSSSTQAAASPGVCWLGPATRLHGAPDQMVKTYAMLATLAAPVELQPCQEQPVADIWGDQT